jgi:hypothetical protein
MENASQSEYQYQDLYHKSNKLIQYFALLEKDMNELETRSEEFGYFCVLLWQKEAVVGKT